MSQSSKRNNASGGANRSMGKKSSHDGHSLAQSNVSGAMGNTAKSAPGNVGPNIVIDIESENLTYNQARSIRLQLQRDVEQLRNRVRMLQNEELRAIKKIEETRKKTRELQDLQNKNDNKVMQRRREEQQRQQKEEADREAARKRRDRERQELNFRNKNFRDQKMAAVEEVRRQKEQMKHNLYGMREENYNQAQFRKQTIREQKAQGLVKQNEFIKKKRGIARHEVDTQAHHMTQVIGDYEKESMELERLENELLRKLQETQVQERAAFQRLETAMVDGSIPPTLRAGQSIQQRSNANARSQVQYEQSHAQPEHDEAELADGAADGVGENLDNEQ